MPELSVTLDSRRQVSGVTVGSLPDPLRTPAGLQVALGRAYLDAVGAQLDERRPRPPVAEGQRPVARTERTPAPPRSDHFGYSSHAELEEFWKRPVPPALALARREVGVSANDCVRVQLHTTDHFADLDVDPGWLRTARLSSVATALLEAFEDAYTQRNQR